jgi:hypothetical protein
VTGQRGEPQGTAGFVEGRVAEDSIFAVLHRECDVLFPNVLFADLFDSRGRRSVPSRIVAVVMVLQRLHGLSDRDAVAAFEFGVPEESGRWILVRLAERIRCYGCKATAVFGGLPLLLVNTHYRVLGVATGPVAPRHVWRFWWCLASRRELWSSS